MEKLLEQILQERYQKTIKEASNKGRNLYSAFDPHEGEDERCKAK